MKSTFKRMIKSRTSLFLAVVATVGLVACATAPRELVDARTTYQEVAQGPAGEYAPAELQTAAERLEQAEQAFKKDGDSDVTRALAYRATRAAQIAETSAATYQARAELEDGKQQLLAESEEGRRELQGSAAAARAELEKARQDLETANREGRLTDQQLAERQEELRMKEEALQRNEKQLAVTETELEGERERREAAEARLKELRAQLDEFAQVEEDNERIVVTLTGEVLFATDKSTLRGPATARLAQVSEALLADRDRRVTVVGHTDSQGSDAHNKQLSQERANSVRIALISQGIAEDRIQAIGQGESQPVAPNDTPDGRAQNRRVEIIIDKTSEQASR